MKTLPTIFLMPSSIFLISILFIAQPLSTSLILKSGSLQRISPSSSTAKFLNSYGCQLKSNTRFTSRSFPFPKLLLSSSRMTLRMSGIDIPLIPAIIGTAVAVFAVFNIENPVDLTDRGRAEARAKRRAERIAKGETFNPKDKESESYRVFMLIPCPRVHVCMCIT